MWHGEGGDGQGLSFSDLSGGDQRPRRGRSAGPDFSPMRNRGKNRQRRGLPPPCGIHPAVLGVPASSFFNLSMWHGEGGDGQGLSFSDLSGGDQRPRRGRSAGPDFSPMRNRGKNRQRRGLPPPCGIHPAVLGVPASSLFRPLARWSHIDGFLFYGSCSLLCSYVLLLPGPYSGEPLFPAIEGLAPGGGNAASPGFGPFWSTRPTAAGKRPHTTQT